VSNPRLDAALTYASRGWPVFPCHHPQGGGCSCGQADCSSPAKHPATPRGLHNATTDPSRIERWWRQRPLANVAIRTGAPGRLVVVDVDLPHGPQSLAALLGPRPGTVRTGSGGVHHYFDNRGLVLRNSAGRLGLGLDVRADGGYVIAPPSRHINGAPYTWTASTLQLSLLPAAIAHRLRRTPERVVQPRPNRDMREWAKAVLEEQVHDVRHAPEGTRNNTLNRAAFRLGRLAARGDIDPGLATTELEAAAQAAGLPAREASRTTASGLHAGLRGGSSRYGHSR
jgi:hypothetical protein